MNNSDPRFNNIMTELETLTIRENIDPVIMLYSVQQVMAENTSSTLLQPLYQALNPIVIEINNLVNDFISRFDISKLDAQISMYYSLMEAFLKIETNMIDMNEFAYSMRRIKHIKESCSDKHLHTLIFKQHDDTKMISED